MQVLICDIYSFLWLSFFYSYIIYENEGIVMLKKRFAKKDTSWIVNFTAYFIKKSIRKRGDLLQFSLCIMLPLFYLYLRFIFLSCKIIWLSGIGIIWHSRQCAHILLPSSI